MESTDEEVDEDEEDEEFFDDEDDEGEDLDGELEDEDEDFDDATLDDEDEDDDFDDEEEDDSESEEEDDGSIEDADAVLDDESGVDDDDVAAADKELEGIGEFDESGNLDDDEPTPELPEEADIISFNDDEDNRKFLVIDVADMATNDKVKLIKLYDMDNEPDEIHAVRVQTDRLKNFTGNIEVVSRMNAKTFGNYVTMVEEYPKSKEKLV